jgi:hypothetical protein
MQGTTMRGYCHIVQGTNTSISYEPEGDCVDHAAHAYFPYHTVKIPWQKDLASHLFRQRNK